MPKRTTDFREDLLTDLADPEEAAAFLNAALEDSEQMALVALRDIAEARKMAKVAEVAGVAREALYRMLTKTGNPRFSSLVGILNALGLKLSFAPTTTEMRPSKKALHPPYPSVAGSKDSPLGIPPCGVLEQGVPKSKELVGTIGKAPPKKSPRMEYHCRAASQCGEHQLAGAVQ